MVLLVWPCNAIVSLFRYGFVMKPEEQISDGVSQKTESDTAGFLPWAGLDVLSWAPCALEQGKCLVEQGKLRSTQFRVNQLTTWHVVHASPVLTTTPLFYDVSKKDTFWTWDTILHNFVNFFMSCMIYTTPASQKGWKGIILRLGVKGPSRPNF